MSDRFERHAAVVTGLTFVSRVTGLARDAALSRVFGVGPVMDAFWFAFIIPNLFRRLFGEGALTAAFLPVYSQLDRDDPRNPRAARTARALASLIVALLVIGLGGLTLIGEIALAAIAMREGEHGLAVRLMMIMLPYMPLVCLVAILGAMLQVHGRFGATAAAPIVLNLSLVAAAAGLVPWFGIANERERITHISIVAGSVVAAGVIQVIWSLWSLRGTSHAWTLRDRQSAREPLRRILANAGPMLLGLGVLQLNTLLDGLIASYPTMVGPRIFGVDFPLEPGAMASLSYAQRLYEFPLGVFGIAVATAIFPVLARSANEPDAYADILRRGLRLVVFIGLPASAGLVLVRDELTAVILQGGDFTAQDTQRVSFILLGYAPAIWAYSMTHVLTRAFYARGDARTPVKVAVGMVALNLALNVTLIWTPLREAGLAWSTAACAVVQVMILLMLVRHHARTVVARDLLMSWLKSGGATAVMVAAVMVIASALPERELAWSWEALRLAILVIVGGAIVIASAIALRMPELRWALGRTDRP